MAWSNDSNYLCSGSDDCTLKLWNINNGECVKTIQAHGHHVTCVCIGHQTNLIISGSFDEIAKMWDIQTGKCLKTFPNTDIVTAVDFSYDGTLALSASIDGFVHLWDVSTGKCLKTIVTKTPISFSSFTPNSKYVLISTLDGLIKVWDYVKEECIKVYKGHKNSSYFIPCCIGKNNILLTGSEDNNLYCYHLNSKEILEKLSGHSNVVTCLDVNDSLIVSGDKDQTIIVWKIKNV